MQAKGGRRNVSAGNQREELLMSCDSAGARQGAVQLEVQGISTMGCNCAASCDADVRWFQATSGIGNRSAWNKEIGEVEMA
jgi:hypothetical protein